MNPGIFEFQSMMNSVVNGISGSLLTAVQSLAYILMTICLILGIYEAYVKGGDIRSLAATFLKYAVAAFVIGYWPNFFSDLFTGFNQIANTIDSSYGAGDLAANWLNGLKALWTSQGYDSIFNGIAFSPDESRLYIVDTGGSHAMAGEHHIRSFSISKEGGLSGGEVFAEVSPGLADGLRVDSQGNVWTSAGDGVHCYSPQKIGKDSVLSGAPAQGGPSWAIGRSSRIGPGAVLD